MINSKIYARFPVLYQNNIIFTTNNSIYSYNQTTKLNELLLTTDDEISNLIINDDTLIFTSLFEGGPDIYSMNLLTKEIERLTFSENFMLKPIYFKNNKLIFISDEHTFTRSLMQAYEMDIQTKEISELEYSSIYSFSKDYEKNDVYVQKNAYGYLMWKNYKGGRKGSIYKNGKELINLPGQCISPIYYNNRVYFIYEDNNDTNIYSCNTKGKDLQKHTDHQEFKLQHLTLHNNELIYMQIGEIFIYNIETKQIKFIDVSLQILQPKEKQTIHLNYLTSIESNEEKLICAIRGNIFEKNLYSGGFKQISTELRYVFTGFINNKIFGFKDGRETALHIFTKEEIIKHQLKSQKLEHIETSSKGWIAYSNHTNELYIIDEKGENKLIAKAIHNIKTFEWSKDGNSLVYELPNENNTAIVLYSLETNTNIYIINDQYHNYHPTFDPKNRFIAFLSKRKLLAKMEELKFDYRLQIENNVYYVPLKENYNLLTPWSNSKEYSEKINLENIQEKIVQIPITKKMKNIIAINGKILGKISKNQTLTFSLDTLSEEIKTEEIDNMLITNDKKSIVYINTNNTIKIHSIDSKPEENCWKNKPINFNACKSIINKEKELENIFDELTWFMEEFYWSEKNISNFKSKIQNYKKFLTHIKTENELYELLNQIQGEMKTSHSYIFSEASHCTKGYLGLNLNKNLEIKNFIKSTSKVISHPILGSNINIKQESKIKSINGQIINRTDLDKALLSKSNEYISIEFEKNDEKKEYDIKTIDFNTYKRFLYENWVQKNENYIKNMDSTIGYIHINNMNKSGFVDFFINYLNKYNKKSIIIDVRYNTGGHISTLLLEQLAKKKTGIDQSRHFGNYSIPVHSTEGKYVLIINEYTSSDGEIFAENFKQMKLGPIVGERTWGGIVGIMPRYSLINNLMTTQPEFGTVFFDTKTEIENHGVIPDIHVLNRIDINITPNLDEQLNKAIELCKTIKKD